MGASGTTNAAAIAHEERDLRDRVESRLWYHSIELAPGLVTPGWYDCREVADRILPASCAGLRCLDIGTFDGFWAFEMERRGADEVVAIDILDEALWDWPALADDEVRRAIAERKGEGDGFVIAKTALDSRVERIDASVYDLDPERFGSFDLVYFGSLLWHLRDPVLGLERARSVCKGVLISTDAISLPLSWLVPVPVANLDGRSRPYWWKPNTRAYRQMIEIAGFDVVDGPTTFRMPAGRGLPPVPINRATLRDREAREFIFASRFGDPHAFIRARPAVLSSPDDVG
jgi:tRNA (mo5U34)-methyltransferase